MNLESLVLKLVLLSFEFGLVNVSQIKSWFHLNQDCNFIYHGDYSVQFGFVNVSNVPNQIMVQFEKIL